MEKRNNLEGLYKEVFIGLGGTGIEVELTQDDYDYGFDEALRVYRSMSSNSVEFGWIMLRLEAGKQRYNLPSDIDSVRDIRRVRSGVVIGDAFEPFSAAFIQNSVGYALNGGAGSTSDSLLSYEMLAQYQETVGRLFGEHVMYSFEEYKSEIYIHMNPKSAETLGLEVSITKSSEKLMADTLAYRWLRSYTSAVVKGSLGEKYSKFATAPGAQGGTVLKGERLVADSREERNALEQQILDYSEGGVPPSIFIG